MLQVIVYTSHNVKKKNPENEYNNELSGLIPLKFIEMAIFVPKESKEHFLSEAQGLRIYYFYIG